MLVERQGCLSIVVFLVIAAEPIWKGCVDNSQVLPVYPAGQGSTAASGIIRDHHGETPVHGSCPQRSLPEPRVAYDSYAPCVDGWILAQIIQRSAQGPCPCRNGAPGIRSWRTSVINLADAVIVVALQVRFRVMHAESADRITMFQDIFIRPAARIQSPLRYLVTWSVIPKLNLVRKGYLLQVRRSMVALEIDSQEGRDRLPRPVRNEHQHYEIMLSRRIQHDPDLLHGRKAAEGIRDDFRHFEGYVLRCGRLPAVHPFAEQFHEFGPALLPLAPATDRLTAGKNQRFRQLIGRNLGFIIIGFPCLRGKADAHQHKKTRKDGFQRTPHIPYRFAARTRRRSFSLLISTGLSLPSTIR